MSSSSLTRSTPLSGGGASSPMWDQIQRMPFQQLQETSDFVYVKKVMTLVARYVFVESDPGLTDPQCTISVAKLLKIVSSKCLAEFDQLTRTASESAAETTNMKNAFAAQLASKEEEVARLNDALRKALAEGASPKTATEQSSSDELLRLKAENDELTLQVRGLGRRNEELKQSLASRTDDRSHINESYDKAQLEYRHLAARYKRLADRAAKTEDMLEEMRRKERGKKQDANEELDRLRQKVQTLQEENYALVQSRDRAEELCEKREAEALRDMTELRHLTTDLLDEERAKRQALHDEFLAVRQESDAHVEQLIHQHEVDLDEKEEELAVLRRQLEKATSKHKARFRPDSSLSPDASSSSSGSSADNVAPGLLEEGAKGRAISNEEQRRLERENDDLHAEVEQLELRIDALDEENRRLTRLIKNYENGNEGLYRLRQELADHTRTVEVLQGENAQLRERLNGMEDSVTFNAALRELCKRVGVTEEEINSLRPQNAAAYSEMDTLKEELSLLKEEVEWLERERRHWMNKVRLQPLMDTKLRFELGLSAEQLKQLDKLVDQMKAGAVIVEDDDESYKDKYFKELQIRRRDAEQFNAFVKDRITEALKNAFVDVSAPDTAAAVSALREHIDVITASSTTETAAQAQERIDRLTRRLEELEASETARLEEIARLREQVVAGTAEKEVICRERDQYREAIFGAAGIGTTQPEVAVGADARTLGDFGESSAGVLSNAKWLSVSNTLREQLRVKDTLIDSLNKELAATKERLEAERTSGAERRRAVETEKKEETALLDQIKALTELNEDLSEKCAALERVNKDLEEGLERLERGSAKEMLLKVVLLRRREATLLQRLRRALTAAEETSTSERRVQAQVQSTLERLREVLEGGGGSATTDAVLPRSSAGCSMEGEMLSYLDYAVQHVLHGRMFREDSRFLLHLKQVYHAMETSQELLELRLDAKRLRQELAGRQAETDTLSAEVAGLRAEAAAATKATSAAPGEAPATASPEYAAAALAKSEAEAATYKQKYALAVKRLEARDAEVAQLEHDLDAARQEVVDVRDHVRNLLNERADAPTALGAGAASSPSRAKVSATQLARLEREVAKLKSVNLGLLHHSMDLQSQIKALEVDVEARQQEVALLKSSAESEVVTSFVSAAIREHAALRRQSELALIQAKRLKMQLAATEANYHVVANEATVYKMGAYRLYRKYVEQVVAVVDYLRCVQRASKGALSPHQAEIMDRRLRKTVAGLAECFGRGTMLAMELSDAQNTVTTLEHQLALLSMEEGTAKRDAADARLQEARIKLREHGRLMTECKEEKQFLQAKLDRAEATNRDLNAEVARLEFGCVTVSPLDEELLATLLQLKESVFDKTVGPALVSGAAAATSILRRLGGDDLDDSDFAIREYKNVVLRQTELAQQCAVLKKQVAEVEAERRRAEHTAAQLREEAQQASERAAFVQRQVEDEREKAAQREARLLRAHDTQSEVARRATEHNVQCLQEMVQKKEQQIALLQEQLSAERRKHVEHELGEAVRMERLHEHMFRENTAMVERFKTAIETVGDSVRQASEGAASHVGALGGGGGGGGVEEPLQVLTAETMRLRQELKDARTTIIVLESQLEQQVQQQLSGLNAPVAAAPSLTSAPASAPTQVPPPPPSSPGTNTDALMGIVHNQTAMMESLRQRESQLSAELQREKEQRAAVERRLLDVQGQHIEQGGMLQLLSQVTSAGGASDAPLVAELHAQNAALDQEVRTLRQTLEEERTHAKRFQADAAEWRTHLDTLQAEVSNQQVEAERVQHLAALNEGLRADLNTVKEQNDKLVLAATVLKQKLMEEAHRGGESARHHQQEIALAQRMGTIQQESAGHIKALDHRIRAIQKELNERVDREKAMLEKNTESQRLVYQLHQQLRAKDREVAAMQAQLRQRGSPSPVRTQPSAAGPAAPQLESRGTQMLAADAGDATAPSQRGAENVGRGERTATGAGGAATPSLPPVDGDGTAAEPTVSRSGVALVSAQDALLQPQVAGIVQRETQKQQRDNLAQISSLRSRAHRLEKDVGEAEEQLRGEREASRQLRLQLRQLREEVGRKDAEHASQLANVYRQRGRAGVPQGKERASVDVPTPPRAPVTPPRVPADVSSAAQDSAQALREQVLALESKLQRYEQGTGEVTGLRAPAAAAATAVESAHLSTPADIRAHVGEVRRLEAVIDELRRRVSVEAPAREAELQLRLERAATVTQRMSIDLAALRGVAVSDIESLYSVTRTTAQQTTDELKMELLRKGNELLDLRFTVETMELQLSRLQRHLDDVLAVDAAAARDRLASPPDAASVEALTNVIENLKLVIEKLQRDNAELRSAQAHSARYARQSRELHELQEREKSLQAQLQDLSKELASSRTSSARGGPSAATAELHRRLATAQAAAQQYEVELDNLRIRLADADRGVVRPLDPADGAESPVPPPLPESRFAHQQPRRSPGASTSSAPLQRRLSSLRSSDAGSAQAERISRSLAHRHRGEL